MIKGFFKKKKHKQKLQEYIKIVKKNAKKQMKAKSFYIFVIKS